MARNRQGEFGGTPAAGPSIDRFDDVIECDVAVIGSGAGGSAAALAAKSAGLDVLVLEKDATCGGTTAVSGGWVWAPGNHHARRQGLMDSKEEARAYLQAEAGNHFKAELVDAFLDYAPRMIAFLENQTSVRFNCPTISPDYHFEYPGAKEGGRALMVEPFDGRELGADIAVLRPPLRELTVLGMMLGSGRDVLHFMRVTRSATSAWFVIRRLARHCRDLALHGRGMELTNGAALAGRLLKSLRDMGISVKLQAQTEELCVGEGGRVTGLIVKCGERRAHINVRRAVVLACGGFSHDLARREALFAHARRGPHSSLPPSSNTGDGLRLAQSVGASMETSLSNPAGWVPVSRVPRGDGSYGLFPHFVDRAKPGVIAVTRQGQRFTNEAATYHDFVQGMFRAAPSDEPVTAYLVCDHRALRRYGLGAVKPSPVPIWHKLRSGYLVRARTVDDLARTLAMGPAVLRATIESYNRDAALGHDPAYGKGGTRHNRYMGDPEWQPNPCNAPLQTPPYYAVAIEPGDLGTFAGLRTDAAARVLDTEGRPVPGLYAVGNDMASVMAGSYPGAGAMLSAAMTFGYIAAQDIAASPRHEIAIG
ncbi:MAG: FAD-dependent oxidoreductase [Hyphomicrobiaceae bacterium]|nr:FAD-dependent oxidoreductase [Hyphomicrobiaceae bacterium]